ncbi:5'-3' exonuclease [Allocatelliglobosispora scoriae]|uniref:5'-3' exonuclease n=1 Tax=Allocatelliglobosispora scoriae TaxID=643052 RepID=A0A841C456_9ACTN|nr:5'-3' exonuclease [Allocatelliglobosispora scoriae]
MTLLAVDAPSLYFRAFFGVPESAAKAPDGSPVNAVRGFLDMISTLVKTRRPTRLICALDADWRPQWRVDLIPSYKAHRVADPVAGVEEIPDLLSPQVEILLDFLRAFGIPAYGVPGYEADDVLGTLAARSTRAAPVEVISGDRDLFQLVDDDRRSLFLYCGRGVAKLEVCDDAAVQAKYGVPASGYADFAALRGDASDGLPGVPGVGEKTAAGLISRFGDLDTLMAALDDPKAEIKPGLRTKLRDASAYLAVAPTVCKVATDVPLPEVDDALPAAPADPDALIALAEQWNLAGAAKRLVDALAARAALPE